jgi:glycolate oxidase
MGSFTHARDAAETVAAIIDTGAVPAALEWLDRAGIAGLQHFTDTGYPSDVDATLLIDVDGTVEQVDRDTKIIEQVLRRKAVEVRRADDEESRAKLWYGRVHASDNVVAMGKGFFIGDVTVPRNRIPDMQEAIRAAAARHTDGLLFIAVAGHAGDGDLHPITFFDRDNPRASAALEAANNEIVDAALSLGGTITGEHGVGTEKRQFMTKRLTPVEVAAQRAIKRAFDPMGLLNPGVMLPDASPDEPNLDFFESALNTALHDPQVATVATVTTVTGGNQIGINTANLSLVVGAAVTLDELSRHLTDRGVNCPAIPAEPTQRTVGELIANASGNERNTVRHNLLGLEVALTDGGTARFGGENMKDVAGATTPSASSSAVATPSAPLSPPSSRSPSPSSSTSPLRCSRHPRRVRNDNRTHCSFEQRHCGAAPARCHRRGRCASHQRSLRGQC